MKYLRTLRVCLFSCVLIASSAFSQPIPENQYVESGGVSIRYVELGSGELVIAIHGYSSNSDSWLERVSSLAENYRLILFDQRGHGLSDKPHTVSEYGREMGHDVIRLMDHLHIPKAHILGYSLGVAPIAMVITENESRFISAVFGGGSAIWEWGSARDLLNQHSYERFLNTSRRQVFSSSVEGQDSIALANLRLGEKQLVVSKQSLSNLSIPILAIVGSEDPALEAVENFTSTFPAIELIVIDGGTHLSAPEHIEFLESIQRFFAKNQEN
jgi:pimeloyl-ACP methyl ester carboxylesterase